MVLSFISMINIRSIYEQASDEDGFRVLVMRYWPRGIRRGACDLWLKGLAPSAGLIRAWKDGSIDWAEFRKSYLAEYESDAIRSEALNELKKILKREEGRAVTLLCSCKDERCHSFIIHEMLDEGR